MKKYGDHIPCFDCGEAKARSDYHRSRLVKPLQSLQGVREQTLEGMEREEPRPRKGPQ